MVSGHDPSYSNALTVSLSLSFQTASAYVLFYRRRTEGRPVRRNILDRSLSQSFADEHKKLKEKYATLEEEKEEKGATKQEKEGTEKMEADTELNTSGRSRNEVIRPGAGVVRDWIEIALQHANCGAILVQLSTVRAKLIHVHVCRPVKLYNASSFLSLSVECE